MESGEYGGHQPKIVARLAVGEERHELAVAKAWGYKLHEWRELSQGDRDLLLAHDELVCRRCGNLRTVCSNPSIDWHAHTSVCWPSATAEWGNRRFRELHEDDKKSAGQLRETDGVVVFPSTLEPEFDPFA